MSCFGSWTGPLQTNWEHTPIFELIFKYLALLNQKSTWQVIADLNMKKSNSWNNQETIQTSFKGVIANSSQLDYGRLGH